MSEDARRCFAAVARNRDFILEVLSRVLPADARVLEIASGSGEHGVFMAKALPQITWMPTDADRNILPSIDAWRVAEGLENVQPPKCLDVLASPWPVERADAVVNINMIHVSPWEVCEALLRGTSHVLPSGGILYMYGPYMRGGRYTAPSNAEFDQTIRAMNSSWGVRNLEDVQATAQTYELELQEIVAMPANNLSVIYRRR
jgi:cyclopropane fatty-acyl-phospholipid synthase-like methyltransferase